MTDQTHIPKWATDYDQQQIENSQYEKLPAFKCLDGETQTIEKFLDEGKPVKNQNGESILFTIQQNGTKKYWWVKITQFTILKEIRKNMPVTGKSCRVTRVGSGKQDTRYSLKFS